MSPFSNSYSSLEEAWGLDNFASGYPKKKKTKKAMRDPICDLYEMGSSPSRAYNELDVMNVVNQKPSAMQQREPELEEPIEVELPPMKEKKPPTKPPVSKHVEEGDGDDDDMSEFIGYIDKKVGDARKAATNMVFPIADVGLYMISGIILIFMMEQFIKIGMMMRSY